jgi:hypothetical protein
VDGEGKKRSKGAAASGATIEEVVDSGAEVGSSAPDSGTGTPLRKRGVTIEEVADEDD